MDIKTALSIYNDTWLIEPQVALQMLDFWEQVKAGATWDYRLAKGEQAEGGVTIQSIQQSLFEKDSVVVAPEGSWAMKDFKGFDGATVAVIPVSGPLMKNDYCGSFGTKSLAALSNMASATESVKAIVYLHDSPGGATSSTEVLASAIKSSPKLTISLVEGYMCSASYWVGCAADKIYATSKTDIIGSIGTMCMLVDNSKALEKNGIVLREYYATASTDKNADTREAKAGDGKRLIMETLDPLNNVFMNAVKENRKGKIDVGKENVLSGKTYLAEDAISAGLIDGIKSFDKIVAEVTKGAERKPQGNQTIIYSEIKTDSDMSQMTAKQLQAEHPAIYNEIYNAGVEAGKEQETNRVKAWQEFQSIDAEAVAKGIAEGKAVDMNVIAAMSAKAMAKATAEAVKQDNPKDVKTPETTSTTEDKTEEEKNMEDFLAQCKKEMGISA